MFGSTRKSKGLKKSVSTPSLSTRRKTSSTSDDTESGDFSKRKLSFNSEIDVSSSKVAGTKSDLLNRAISFEGGFLNSAFADNTGTPSASTSAEYTAAAVALKTPVIRKALCPSVRTRRMHDADVKENSVLQGIDNTPKIMKPKVHRTPAMAACSEVDSDSVHKPTSTKLKVKGLRVSGQLKRLASFSKKTHQQKPQQAAKANDTKAGKVSSRNHNNKENIFKVTGL